MTKGNTTVPPLTSLNESEAFWARFSGLTGGTLDLNAQLRAEVAPGKLSIITPCLNAERTLHRTAATVSQLPMDYEHIIVDGGSQDGTLGWLEEQKFNNLLWVSAPDSGISDAFNRGISLARGEYILIVNADDWVEPEAIEKRLERLKSAPNAAFVFSDLDMYSLEGEKLYRLYGEPDYQTRIRHSMPALNHPSVIVRRSAYQMAGLFDPKWRVAMDYAWLLKAHKQGLEGRYISDAAACMMHHGISETNFFRGLREVRDISIQYGYSRIAAHARFSFRFLKGVMRKHLIDHLPQSLALSMRSLVNPSLRSG